MGSSNPYRVSTASTSTSGRQSGDYFESPAMMGDKRRTSSYSSDVSVFDGTPSSPPKSHTFIKPTATVNVYTTCGRHTDQLLFGGPSLTELARSFIKRH